MEENQARTYFRVLMKVFATRYQVFAGDVMVHASFVWHTVMVKFAAALVKHVEVKQPKVVLPPGMTPSTVKDALRLHLEADHPHLVTPFDTALAHGNTMLTWDPATALEIVPKSRSCRHLLRALGVQEADDALGGHDFTGANDTVNQYYGGVWEGENAPYDRVNDSD